jgi:hypothetical protein
MAVSSLVRCHVNSITVIPSWTGVLMTTNASKFLETSARPILVDLGYEYLDEGVYKALWSTVEVEHFIYLFEEPKTKARFVGDFGIRNSVSEAFSCNAIHTYGGHLLQLFKCGEPTSCSMRFSFARLEPADWPIPFPCFSGKELGQHLHDFIAKHLIPTIGHVTTLQDFFSLLAADMTYCPWVASNGAIRAAQIVALAAQTGIDCDLVRGILETRKSFIAHGVSKT